MRKLVFVLFYVPKLTATFLLLPVLSCLVCYKHPDLSSDLLLFVFVIRGKFIFISSVISFHVYHSWEVLWYFSLFRHLTIENLRMHFSRDFVAYRKKIVKKCFHNLLDTDEAADGFENVGPPSIFVLLTIRKLPIDYSFNYFHIFRVKNKRVN